MVVGITRGTKMVPVDDVVRSLPIIEANCIHVWKTGDTDIADYASGGAGYGVLEEETFCTSTSPRSGKDSCLQNPLERLVPTAGQN